MCGRYCMKLNPEEAACNCKYQKDGDKKPVKPKIEKLYNLGRKFEGSYNVSPMEMGVVLTSAKHFDDQASADEIVVTEMLWGFIPPWHKGDYKRHGFSTNNCRIENLLTSKMYKPAFDKGQRCVLLAEGFYEWQTVNEKLKSNERPAYYIYMPQDPKVKLEDRTTFDAESVNLMKIAAIFGIWHDENKDPIYSFTIITFESDKTFKWLHHRTPAILETDKQVSDWLNYEKVPSHNALKIIKNPKTIIWHPVSNYVNNSRNKAETCNQPLSEDKKDVKKSPIKNKMMAAWLLGSSSKRKSTEDSKEANTNKKMKLENDK